MGRTLSQVGSGVLLALTLATAGCSTVNSAANSVGDLFGGPHATPGTPGYVRGFLGGVAADEPQAALIGREVLSAGGDAADAAVAMGFMLSVTLPSRAGLGGGGACIAYDPAKSSVNGGVPEALLFLPGPGGGSGERPAAVPMLARGLFALHARYGNRPFESLTTYAEQAARFGVPASRAFVRDLAVVAEPLAGDPVSRGVFFQANDQPLAEGMKLQQPALAATLGQMRVAGVGDLYVGTLARNLVAAANQAGGGLTIDALRDGLPAWAPALMLDAPNHDKAAFLPPPADGGLAAAAAFRTLLASPDALQQAEERSLAVAGAWRAGGGRGNPASLLAGSVQGAPLPPLPASTGFVAVDRNGRSVTCAVSMNNLFGTGRIAPGTGVLLAASPNWMPPPLLAAALAYNPNIRGFHAAVAASGQQAAPVAAADALLQSLRARARIIGEIKPGGPNAPLEPDTAPEVVGSGEKLRPVPEPGRVNVINCAGYLPGAPRSCGWSTDPRGAGLAVGSD